MCGMSFQGLEDAAFPHTAVVVETCARSSTQTPPAGLEPATGGLESSWGSLAEKPKIPGNHWYLTTDATICKRLQFRATECDKLRIFRRSGSHLRKTSAQLDRKSTRLNSSHSSIS